MTPEFHPDRAERPQVITWRAIGLGVVTVVFQTFLVTYQAHVTLAGTLTLSQFPEASLIVFVLWVMVNSVWRVASPRTALSSTEMLTILVMAWSAGMLGGRAWTGRLVGMLAGPQYLASAENRWREILGGFRQGSLLPLWLFPDFSTEAVRWFYSSVPAGVAIPWAAWASPIFWWCTAAVAFLAFAVATTVIFHRQWAEHERLSFPLISVPVALVEESPGRRLPRLFTRRLFWWGIVASGGVLCWNIVGYFHPGWPLIRLYAPAGATTRQVIEGFPPLTFRVMPLVIGFMYLGNLDLLLSLWVFYLLAWIESGISATTGFAVGSGPVKVTGIDIAHLHSFGALVFLAAWSVYIARRHLAAVVRAAFGRDRRADNPGGVMRYRTALLLGLWALAFLVLFCRRIGMSWGVIGLAMGFNVLAFFTVAKYMAATGLSYINPPYTAGGKLIINMAGNAWMTPRSVIGLGMMHGGYFGQMQRLFGFGMMPHAFKVADRAERGRERMLTALVLAVVAGAAFGLWHILYLGYTRGGARMETYTFQSAPEQDFGYIMKAVDSVQRGRGLPADGEKIVAWGAGLVLCAAVTLAHARFSWWPLHPVGLAFSSTSAGVYWLSIFIVWLAKLVLLRLGGVALYEKAKPFFIGLIVGYVLGLIVSFSVDAIFFPGMPGHEIHNW